MLMGSGIHRYTLATVLMVAVAGVYSLSSRSLAAEESLLGGSVVSSSGQRLAGIPVRAHRANGTITVNVYTNSRGDYSFPGWSDVSPGSYAVAVELPEFEPVTQQVTLSAGMTKRLDFTLRSRQPLLADATASDIVAALPGTDEQKHLVIQCDNCHSLQFALRTGRTKEGWTQIIRRMAGERAISRETPGTRAFGQKKYVEPLAEYLTSIRGPGASDPLPFRLRPRPTGEASTRLVVTEYDIPRSGHRDLSIIRGDRQFVWPHDILLDPKGQYAYYTDHFSFNLGRLDRRTGEVKEFPYSLLSGMGREGMGVVTEGQLRAGNPGGGAHDIAWDREGNVVFGMGGGTVRFNPGTEAFTPWASGSNMFGVDPAGKVWYLDRGLHALDMTSGEVKHYTVPDGTDDDTYDMETDARGRSIMNLWRLGKIGVFDPRSEQFAA
ncbi:MAG: carboxypeptidase regulatory-like domain-containing protein, partial [bacterium]